jgi:hypothetical protein
MGLTPETISVDLAADEVVELCLWFKNGSTMSIVCPRNYADLQYAGFAEGRWAEEAKKGYTVAHSKMNGEPHHAFLFSEVIALKIQAVRKSDLLELQEKVLRNAAKEIDEGEE